MSGIQGRQHVTVDRMARGWWRRGYDDARAGRPPAPPAPSTMTDFRVDYADGYAAGTTAPAQHRTPEA